MDPITLALVSAIAGGMAGAATRSALEGLISLIKNKLGDKGDKIVKAANELEADPESEERKKALAEEVAATNANEDPEILEAAYTVLDKTSSQPKPEESVPLSPQKTSVKEKIGVQEEVMVRLESKEAASNETEDFDVPRFDFFREIPPTKSIHTNGIQFIDKNPEDYSNPPKLYLSIYFKESKYFVPYPLSTNEKWLYLEANMRPAFNLRIQVRALNMRDVDELIGFLHNRRDGWSLHGPRPADDQAGDYFYVWRENDENRLMISTFTATNAGISIHARFSSEVAKAFADYLEEVGFTKPFKE
jgi:hypothetical protein